MDIIVGLHFILILILFLRGKEFLMDQIYAISSILFIIFPYYLHRFVLPFYFPTLEVNLIHLLATISYCFFARSRGLNVSHKIVLLKEQNVWLPIVNAQRTRYVVYVIFAMHTLLLITGGQSSAKVLFTLGVFLLFLFLGFLCNYLNDKKVYRPNLYFILAIALFAITYKYGFVGFGRMILFKFVLGTYIIYGFFYEFTFNKKLIVLLLLPVMIFAGALLRAQKSGTGGLSSIINEGAGIGSIVSPMRETEAIFEVLAAQEHELLKGESYAAAFLFFIPSALWEGKPLGFGSEIVKWFYPEYYVEFHSLAATFIAEPYANFGYLIGIPLSFVLIHIFSFLTRLVYYLLNKRNDFVLGLLVLVIFYCAIPDYIWGGVHASVARSGFTFVPIVLYYFVLKRTIKS